MSCPYRHTDNVPSAPNQICSIVQKYTGLDVRQEWHGTDDEIADTLARWDADGGNGKGAESESPREEAGRAAREMFESLGIDPDSAEARKVIQALNPIDPKEEPTLTVTRGNAANMGRMAQAVKRRQQRELESRGATASAAKSALIKQERNKKILDDLEKDTEGYIKAVQEGGEAAAFRIENSEAEKVQIYPRSELYGPQHSGFAYRRRLADGPYGDWQEIENLSTEHRAYYVSRQAHAGQRDKLGVPYMLHPRGVAEYMETLPEYEALSDEDKQRAKAAAYLHDVLEDTPYTEKDLRDMKFDGKTIEAIIAVTDSEKKMPDGTTRRPSKDEYYEGIKQAGNIAVVVKLADLGHNNLKARRAQLPGAPGKPVPEGGVDQYAKLGKKYVKAYKAFGAAIPEHLKEFDS